jgi:hypothetical protein
LVSPRRGRRRREDSILDTSGIALEDMTREQVKIYIESVLYVLKLDLGMQSFEAIAHDLSVIASKVPPWTSKYIHSIYHGYYKPSVQIMQALIEYRDFLDDTALDGLHPTVVWSSNILPAELQAPASLSVAVCARAGCNIVFIKASPAQKYHSPECAELARKEKKYYD